MNSEIAEAALRAGFRPTQGKLRGHGVIYMLMKRKTSRNAHGGNGVTRRAKTSSRAALARSGAVACALLAFGAAAAFGQVAGTAPRPTQAQILKSVEAQATAYKAAIADSQLQVRQTVRDYDSTGHLKRTRRSSYPYAFQAPESRNGRGARNTSGTQGRTFPGADLADGTTLPFVFLPGSIGHLSIQLETPETGPWILHFKSNPCPPPDLHHRWMGADIASQCVEGKAFVDPHTGALTRIRMEMAGLPVFFHIWPLPVEVEVYQLYNDASFRLLHTDSGAPPRLLPEKSEYVTFTSRSRTVVDRVFEPPAPGTARRSLRR